MGESGRSLTQEANEKGMNLNMSTCNSYTWVQGTSNTMLSA